MSQLKPPRILVVGDVMLDQYRIGEATRISPEAPVPVLLNPRDEYRLGGAGAVAAMCAALGAEVTLAGVVGDDAAGRRIELLLAECGVTFAGVVTASRVTTCKERIIGVASGRHRQQLVRVDCEQTDPLTNALAEDVIARLEIEPDIVLIADYAKGVCVPSVIQHLLQMDVPVLVDPPRQGDWAKYGGCTAIVPNREEASEWTRRAGRRQPPDEEVTLAHDTAISIRGLTPPGSPVVLADELDLNALIIKQDQDGAILYERGHPPWPIAAHVRRVHDVTGAGDQFLAVLGLFLARGSTWQEAVTWANCAAGWQVEQLGCVPITFEDLSYEMVRQATGQGERTAATGPRLAAAG